jgi:hypothetical protein
MKREYNLKLRDGIPIVGAINHLSRYIREGKQFPNLATTENYWEEGIRRSLLLGLYNISLVDLLISGLEKMLE